MSTIASLRTGSDALSKRPPTPAKDLEYGYPAPPPAAAPSTRPSSPRLSHKSGELAWNPQHPCYPHPNPHAPLASPLYAATRIIRIPRDWMIAGDLAPTFSNTYPEILEPWVREADFRILIQGVNERLLEVFNPLGWRAWMDATLGVVTGWLWDDLGLGGAKKGCQDIESFIERWNEETRRGGEKDEEMDLVGALPLRRTGYMSIDIQIPDPRIGMVDEEEESGNTERTTEGDDQTRG